MFGSETFILKLLEFLFIFYNDQQMHNYLAKHHTPTCFDTIVSSSGNL